MSSGGYRPGGGRPKGSRTRQAGGDDIAAKKADVMPLEYMLAVMRDPKADKVRRDRMAIAAAPFCHERVADNRIGKKEAAAIAVQNPDTGSALGELMAVRDQLN